MARSSDFWFDVRYACRLLRRDPVFALVVITTLGLALGANTAVFSLAHKLLIAHLPVAEADRLFVMSRSNREESGITRFSYPFFRELEAETGIFDGILCRGGSERVTVAMEAGGEPAIGELVSGSYFDVLGVRPSIGRLITPLDDVTPGAHPVVVLSDHFWRRRFAGDPTVVGRAIRLSGYPMVVVGVTPPEFDGLDPGQAVDLRMPIAMQAEIRQAPSTLGQRRATELTIVARLKRSVSVERAEEVLTARLHRYLQQDPASGDAMRLVASERLDLLPAANGVGVTRRQHETSLRALMIITVCVLMVACLNVANLLVARGSARAREFAVRAAIGAASGRLFRQVLTESVVISLCGAVVGAILAYPAAQLLVRLMAVGGPGSRLDVEPNFAILGLHVAAAAVATGLFGLAPAQAARRLDLVPELKGAAQRARNIDGRSLFVASQVTLSVVVLVGALLFLRTVHALRSVDLGFRADHVLMVALSPKNAGHGDERVLPFFREVRERVSTVPGVTAATYAVVRPLSNASWRTPVVTSGCCPRETATSLRNVVGPNYFETLGIPLVAGRDFTEHDDARAPKVAIVNESFARLYASRNDAIGTMVGVERPEFTIVGVVKDSKYAHIREGLQPIWYVPYEQQPNVKYLDLYVRTAHDPERLSDTVRRVIASVDPAVAAFDVRTLRAQMNDLLVSERLVASLATFFGVTAAALAALGTYGTLAFLVTHRRWEIGVRMALGARRIAIVRLVTADAWRAVGGGLIVGATLSAGLSHYTASLLFGVTPLDPASLIAAILAMGFLATLAAALPARRACRIDPAVALRDK